MTEAFAHRAAAAFEAALHQVEGLLAASPEVREPAAAVAAAGEGEPDPAALSAALSAEELGERAALLAVAERAWRSHLGTLLDTRQVQALMGVGTRQAVSDRAKRGGLLALPTADGRRFYPAFQFGLQGQPHPGVAEVLRELAGAELSPYTVASWFRTPQPLLEGATPAAWMQADGALAPLVEAARRSAARLAQ